MKLTHPVLEARIRRLDEISSDIRSLEAYLVSTGFRCEVRAGDLSWQQLDGKRWRITWKGQKPLIEATADVRMSCTPGLIALLSEMGAIVDKLCGKDEP